MFLAVKDGQRFEGAGELRAGAFYMRCKAAFHIGADAGVKPLAFAFENIKIPALHAHAFGGVSVCCLKEEYAVPADEYQHGAVVESEGGEAN